MYCIVYFCYLKWFGNPTYSLASKVSNDIKQIRLGNKLVDFMNLVLLSLPTYMTIYV